MLANSQGLPRCQVSLRSCLLLVLLRVARHADEAGRYIAPSGRTSRATLSFFYRDMRKRFDYRTRLNNGRRGDATLMRCMLAVLTAYPNKVLP